MGHSEMLLAVAGLDDEEVRQRTEKLASGDWSDFAPAEQAAFQFAYKLTREPRHIADADVQRLIDTFGQQRALDLIWHASWCNYMTRVADAFQLPLEPENVFQEPPAPAEQGSVSEASK
jgi:alkylhydroperoxidase family enzyme